MTDERMENQPEAEEMIPEQVSAAPEAMLTDAEKALEEKYDRYITSSFDHSIDSKGRMVIPLSYRARLGSPFVVTVSFDFKSMAIYSKSDWVHMREKYEQIKPMDAVLKQYLQFRDEYTMKDVELDNQGRVLLPAKIRALTLGDEKDVVVAGAGDHITVKTRSAADQQLQAFLSGLETSLANIPTF